MKTLVNIDVPELKPAITFYCAALGLQHTRNLDDDVAELAGASSVIYLLQHPPDSIASARVSAARSYDRHWTLVHIDFVINDIDCAIERALDAGAIRKVNALNGKAHAASLFQIHLAMVFVLSNLQGRHIANKSEGIEIIK